MSTFGELQELEDDLFSICRRIKISVPTNLIDRILVIKMTALTHQGGHRFDTTPEMETLGGVATFEFKKLKKRLEPRLIRLWRRYSTLYTV